MIERIPRRLRRYKGESVFRTNGVQMDIDVGEIAEFKKKRIVDGGFGVNTQITEKMAEHSSEPTDLIEIGAGTGWMSAKHNAHTDGQHIAVEPDPRVIPTLRRTRELNDCDYEVVQAAYSPNPRETLKLYDNYNDNSLYSGRGEASKTVEVDGITIKELHDRYDLGDVAVHCNAEGAEYALLDNELRWLRENCSVLALGIHGFTDHDTERYVELLDEEFEMVWETGEIPGTEIYRNPRV